MLNSVSLNAMKISNANIVISGTLFRSCSVFFENFGVLICPLSPLVLTGQITLENNFRSKVLTSNKSPKSEATALESSHRNGHLLAPESNIKISRFRLQSTLFESEFCGGLDSKINFQIRPRKLSKLLISRNA